MDRGGVVMVAEMMKIEFELDEKRHGELSCEAERLGISMSEVARRAVAAWLGEMADDSPCKQATLTADA